MTHDTTLAQHSYSKRVQVLQVQEQRREHTHEARSRTLTVKPPPLCTCPLQGGGCPLEEGAIGYITIQGCTGIQGASIGSGTLLPGQPLVVSNSTLAMLYEYKNTNKYMYSTNKHLNILYVKGNWMHNESRFTHASCTPPRPCPTKCSHLAQVTQTGTLQQ